jgi:hypothetical protein
MRIVYRDKGQLIHAALKKTEETALDYLTPAAELMISRGCCIINPYIADLLDFKQG